jgi:hypothetical protein
MEGVMGGGDHDCISAVGDEGAQQQAEGSLCAFREDDFLLAGLWYSVHSGDELADVLADEPDASGLRVAAYTDDILKDAVCPRACIWVYCLTVD